MMALRNRHYNIYIPFLIFFFIIKSSFAQDSLIRKSDNAVAKKKISWQRIRLYFDDDYINFAGKGTDKYYTAGWQIDAFYKRNYDGNSASDRLLIRLPDANDLYYYGINRRIYTPANTSQSQIVYGDRPYASVVTIQHGLISTNLESSESLSTDIAIGAIGPLTHGGDIQNWFHGLIGDQKAKGWDNQVKNDIVLDYKINYERLIINPTEHIEILGNTDCEVGTLVDNFGFGVTLTFGKFANSYTRDNLQILKQRHNSNKILFHFYMHPTVRVVMYNATLRGGFFSGRDPYIINENDINYVYLQYDFGFVLFIKNFGISFAEKLRTAEFRTGGIQQVGNVTFLVPL